MTKPRRKRPSLPAPATPASVRAQFERLADYGGEAIQIVIRSLAPGSPPVSPVTIEQDGRITVFVRWKDDGPPETTEEAERFQAIEELRRGARAANLLETTTTAGDEQ